MHPLSLGSEVPGYANGAVLGNFDFTPSGLGKNVKFAVTRGDYAELMRLVVEELENAKVKPGLLLIDFGISMSA